METNNWLIFLYGHAQLRIDRNVIDHINFGVLSHNILIQLFTVLNYKC